MTCSLSKTSLTSPFKIEISVDADWFSHDVKKVCKPGGFELEIKSDNSELWKIYVWTKFSLNNSRKTKQLFQELYNYSITWARR